MICGFISMLQAYGIVSRAVIVLRSFMRADVLVFGSLAVACSFDPVIELVVL